MVDFGFGFVATSGDPISRLVELLGKSERESTKANFEKKKTKSVFLFCFLTLLSKLESLFLLFSMRQAWLLNPLIRQLLEF